MSFPGAGMGGKRWKEALDAAAGRGHPADTAEGTAESALVEDGNGQSDTRTSGTLIPDSGQSGNPLPDEPVTGNGLSANPLADSPLPSTPVTGDDDRMIAGMLEQVRGIENPVERANEATRAIEVFEAAARLAQKIRRRSIAELLQKGNGVTKVAKATGMSVSTVKNIRTAMLEQQGDTGEG